MSSLAFFLAPLVGDGAESNPRRPQYFVEEFSAMAWGNLTIRGEPWGLVGCDPTAAQRAALLAKPELVYLGDDDSAEELPPAAIPAIRALGLGEPGLSQREAIRSLCGAVVVAQRVAGLRGNRGHASHVDFAASTLGLAHRGGKVAEAGREFAERHPIMVCGREVGAGRRR